MKYPASFIACLLIGLTLLGFRTYYSGIAGGREELRITQWDAFGYYLYLPATIIYQDHKKLHWAPAIDSQYNVTGGDGLPVQQLENGNLVCKYLCGVAILQTPLFLAAHAAAIASGYPADGFSPPYQYALAFGVIAYCLLSLFLLRRILLRYFTDRTTALTLLLLCLASNFIQYASVDNGLSHAWIFPLYILLLHATIRWHSSPRPGRAAIIGLIIGLATICRPTEAIALFIPLLWGTHTREAARAKWQAVRAHRLHILYAVLGGIAGILPQLLYWYSVTGSPIYDVGSKWMFFDPWFRVLFGWEKGWFIYTPVTILFVAGLLFMRRFDFCRAALVFCLLNIWIVIAWEDWRYGASYSARALVQSYPVFALPLATIISRIDAGRWRVAFYALSLYLIGVNLFQTVQYNSTVLHYNDMNRAYYSRIYLNPNPTPLDMSLLDTDEWPEHEGRYEAHPLLKAGPMQIQLAPQGSAVLADTLISGAAQWIKVEAFIDAPDALWGSRLEAKLRKQDSVRTTAIRLYNPVGRRSGRYAFYVRVPDFFRGSRLSISLLSSHHFSGQLRQLDMAVLQKKD